MYAGTVWHVLVLLNSAVLGLSIEIIITIIIIIITFLDITESTP